MSVKFHQKEWQGIKFSSFVKTYSSQPAGAEFYLKFYEALFRKYSDFSDLDPKWILAKNRLAHEIIKNIEDSKTVLSVGCGLGVVEAEIYKSNKFDLYIHEIANTALKWVSKIIPHQKILLGAPKDSLPQGMLYDCIVMNAVDYVFTDNEFIENVSFLRSRIAKDGALLITSASFIDSERPYLEKLSFVFKEKLKLALDFLGLKDIGQFWGYMRNRNEYRKLVMESGFKDYEDGFFETCNGKVYWIKGLK